jgi:hypothetical protein
MMMMPLRWMAFGRFVCSQFKNGHLVEVLIQFKTIYISSSCIARNHQLLIPLVRTPPSTLSLKYLFRASAFCIIEQLRVFTMTQFSAEAIVTLVTTSILGVLQLLFAILNWWEAKQLKEKGNGETRASSDPQANLILQVRPDIPLVG